MRSCLSTKITISSSYPTTIAGLSKCVSRFSGTACKVRESRTEQTNSPECLTVKIGSKVYVVKTRRVAEQSPTLPLDRETIKPKCGQVTLQSAASPPLHLESKDRPVRSILKKGALIKIARNLTKKKEENASVAYTAEGLEISSILKHPLFDNVSKKPFIESDFEYEIKAKPLKDYPFYVPSVQDILGNTASPHADSKFLRWNESYMHKLGTEGYRDFQKDLLQNGKDFQNLMEEFLRSGNDTLSVISPLLEAYWESMKPVLKHVENVKCFQVRAVHPHLRYYRFVDCIATYKGKPVVIEWQKTYSKKENLPAHCSEALKVAASMGAINFDEGWPFQVRNALLIFVYSDGSPADVHFFTARKCQIFWKQWLRRLEQYWKMHSSEDFTKEKLVKSVKNEEQKGTSVYIISSEQNQPFSKESFVEVQSTEAQTEKTKSDLCASSTMFPQKEEQERTGAHIISSEEPQPVSKESSVEMLSAEAQFEQRKSDLFASSTMFPQKEEKENCRIPLNHSLQSQSDSAAFANKNENCDGPSPTDTSSKTKDKEGFLKSLWKKWIP